MADSLAQTPTPVSTTVAETAGLASAAAASSEAVTKARFLGRTVTVYELLGSGAAADLMLWKDWKKSAVLLAGVAVLWVLFELSGFTVVSLVGDAAMIFIAVVFVWAQVSHFTKRSLPKIPELKLSSETVIEFTEASCNVINAFLHTAQSIALGRNYLLFGKIMGLLYLVTLLGSLLNGLNLAFLTFVVAFTVPYFYDKYEDKVDEQLIKLSNKAQQQYAQAELKAKELAKQVQSKVQEKLSQVRKKEE